MGCGKTARQNVVETVLLRAITERGCNDFTNEILTTWMLYTLRLVHLLVDIYLLTFRT